MLVIPYKCALEPELKIIQENAFYNSASYAGRHENCRRIMYQSKSGFVMYHHKGMEGTINNEVNVISASDIPILIQEQLKSKRHTFEQFYSEQSKIQKKFFPLGKKLIKNEGFKLKDFMFRT